MHGGPNLPVPNGEESHNWLAPQTGDGPLQPVPDDYTYIEEVVVVGYPIKRARQYLARHLGNPVTYRLVAVQRGEKSGIIRQAEIIPAGGGENIHVRAVRTLPDGTPASYFAPTDLVMVRATVQTTNGGTVPPLGPMDRIVLHVPVRSYQRFLPAIYQGAVPTRSQNILRPSERAMRQWGAREEARTTLVDARHADQFQRFLFIFQHLMTTVVDKIDGLPDLTNPSLANPKFLPWIASWVSFELDESLPIHQQRELVRRSIRLHRTRGTRQGIEEMIQVLTSAPVQVGERIKPQPNVLGAMTLAGGRDIAERYLREEPPAFTEPETVLHLLQNS